MHCLKFLLMLLFIQVNKSDIVNVETYSLGTELIQFFKNISLLLSDSFKFFVFVDSNDINLNKEAEKSISQTPLPAILLNTNKELQILDSLSVTFPSYAFFYFHKFQDINKKLVFSSKFAFLKTSVSTIFIATFELDNTRTLKNFMRSVWNKHRLTHFGVLFPNPKIQLFTYHPFRDEILTTTNIMDREGNFANLNFTDLNGIALRMAIFDNLQELLRKRLGGINADLKIWMNLARNLNVIFQSKYIGKGFQHAMKNVAEGVVDFCPFRYFLTENNDDLDFLDPYDIEYLVALVPEPKKIPQSFYLLMTLTPTFWFLLCASLVSLIVVAVIGMKDKKGKQNLLFSFLRILCNQPIYHISQYKSFHIFLFNLWQSACLLILAAFQLSLLKTLLISKYNAPINTISELKSSNLSIYVPTELRALVEESVPLLKQQLVSISYDDLNLLVLDFENNNKVLILTSYMAELVVEVYRRFGIDSSYHIMKEVLTPGLSTYFFTKNSPYPNIFKNMILKQYQHGLDLQTKFDSKEWKDNSTTKLSLNHLIGVFRILSVGMFLSIIVFSLEKVLHKL
ncbi:hypothetical protein WA026_018527 [Henosepilachna vigintioctopunctata]|uniref:Ionotropic receptor n=1 Tax=Henosepilachna vigintioctopunctata TaxID=420089 RepID=A0AAW1U3A8_9CUCU